VALRIAALKGHVAPDDVTGFRQSLVERSHDAVNLSYNPVKPTDYRQRRLLSASPPAIQPQFRHLQ
jgi:hypothetical protein